MAGERILLLGHHSSVGHTGEKIVRLVVSTHMFEAEPPIFIFAPAAFRRPVARFLLAAMPFAARPAGFWPTVFSRLDADPIKKW